MSFLERDQRHGVKLAAETVYEAACLTLKALRSMSYVQGPGKRAVLEIEADTPAHLYRRKPSFLL